MNVRFSSCDSLSLFWSLPVVFHWVSTDSTASLNRFFFFISSITTSLNSSQQFSKLASCPRTSYANTTSSCHNLPHSSSFHKDKEITPNDEGCMLSPCQIKILRETPSQPCIFYSGFRVALMNGNIHKGLGGSHQIPFFVPRLYHSSIISMELFCVMMLKGFFLFSLAVSLFIPSERIFSLFAISVLFLQNTWLQLIYLQKGGAKSLHLPPYCDIPSSTINKSVNTFISYIIFGDM